MHTETRIDVLTGRTVIIAAGRADRPLHVATAPVLSSAADDPFLEGHEHDTPDECLSLRQIGSPANEPGWLIRVVPNRYPAVAESAVTENSSRTTATGLHDVVIECPDHRVHLSQLSVAELTRVLIAWQRRVQQISAIAPERGIAAISVFRNEGYSAGASLPHCHSQILATDFVGPQLCQRLYKAAAFRQQHRKSLYDDWLMFERKNGRRVVFENEGLAVVCPFASRFAWQTRFCPVGETSTAFCQLATDDLVHLAALMLCLLRSLEQTAGQIDHNLTLTLPPLQQPDAFPWMLDLMPRPSRVAGFELMTDVEIVTVTPETAARQLRDHADRTALAISAAEIVPAGFDWRE
ncbi:MAG: DUF4921 family protein [Fuerstiella sp.]